MYVVVKQFSELLIVFEVGSRIVIDLSWRLMVGIESKFDFFIVIAVTLCSYTIVTDRQRFITYTSIQLRSSLAEDAHILAFDSNRSD